MEELQSTEILDREILEDARKKALRILRTAEETIKAQTVQWEKKTTDSINELDKKYSEQYVQAAQRVMSRLPIDKRRAKIEKIENLLQDAVEAWYKNSSRELILKLLTRELVNRLVIINDQLINKNGQLAKIDGLSRNEAETIIKKINFKCNIEETASDNHYPSITLMSGDTRIIASMQDVIDSLLQEKRAELAGALVGIAFMEGEI
ncbi:MAG: hypothetical protein FWC03_10010 [Treponema sp.]|nr:hypothetical protein [Treponema sp.]